MVQIISNMLGLVWREQWALQMFFDGLKDLFSFGGARGFAATILMMTQMFNMLMTGASVDAWGPELDLTGYEIVFEDEFNGDELNLDVWQYRNVGATRAGFYSPEQITVNDGVLKIEGEYREDGQFGAGWYGGELSLKERYLRGYFEVRMICAASQDFWSAFWLTGENSPYNPETSKGGIESAEIDIVEAFYKQQDNRENGYVPAIHVSGYNGAEGIQTRNLGCFNGDDIYNKYNTYGLKWTEDEYIFYVNGVEATRSSFGNGVCINPEVVILSLCLHGTESFANADINDRCEMLVDYVRIYQLAE